MGHVLRRVGTGAWIVLALVGLAAVAAVLAQVGAQELAGKSLLMKFIEFEPLHARKSALVVDVRDLESYDRGHIPGAIHVPAREMEERVAEVKRAAKGRLVVTYCSCPSEATSLIAARILTEAGVDAKALIGGFPRWVEFGGAIEKR